MKNNGKKGNMLEHSAPNFEEFGLGIQVFKIESNKNVQGDLSNQRKMFKNIENPNFAKPNAFTLKRTTILPSLSTQKKSKFSGVSDSIKERRTTIQKKKISYLPDSIKQIDDKKKNFQKKSSSTHQIIKNQTTDQSVIVKEKEKVQVHYRKSMNELKNFYEKMEEMESDNLKQIRRLKKLKETEQTEEQLSYELSKKQNKSIIISEMVNKQGFSGFNNEQQYDEHDISIYSQQGFKFKYYDVEEIADY